MRKEFNIGTLTRPLSYTARVNVEQGTLSQVYDNMSGNFTPDRSLDGPSDNPDKYRTILAMSVFGVNPNTGQNVTPEVKSSIWYIAEPAEADITYGGSQTEDGDGNANLLRNANFRTMSDRAIGRDGNVIFTNSAKLATVGGSHDGSMYADIPSGGVVTFFYPLETGKTYTFSCLYKYDGTKAYVGQISGGSAAVIAENTGGEWRRAVKTFTIPAGTDTAWEKQNFLRFFLDTADTGKTLSICQPKLEYGEEATAFRLNDEDKDVKKGSLVERRIVSGTDGFVISGLRLIMSLNVPYGKSGSIIRCVSTFTDPITGKAMTCEDKVTLDTALNTSANLTLTAATGTDTAIPYAGDKFQINALKTPPNDDGSNWKVHCRAQLKDGTVVLAPAYTTQGTSVKRTGSAFYFWYSQSANGDLRRLEKSNDWFTVETYGDGSQSQECTVDLAKSTQTTLVCRAGFVPYGEYPDYLDSDGKLSPAKCKYGYLQQRFSLRAIVPPIQQLDYASLSYEQIPESQFADQSTVIGRKCLVTAGGTCVNFIKDSNGKSILTKLYNIVWKMTRDGVTTTIGNGEDLRVTLAQLGATDKEHLPKMYFVVEPKFGDLFGDNYVVGYHATSDDVVPVEVHGNPDFLKNLEFMLVDTTTEDDSKTMEARLLKRNNLLRYADDSYAPTVGITAAMQQECAANTLYSDEECKIVAWQEGKYSAVSEWERYDKPLMSKGGKPRTLYKKASDGTISEVSHKLRPWETTETKYTIGIGYTRKVYLLDNVVGESGTKWSGILTDVTSWDGIDLTPYAVAPTAMGPGYFCTVGGKARNFFYLYKGEDYCHGFTSGDTSTGKQIGDIAPMSTDRTYPRVQTVTQISSMGYCRSNNADPDAPYPMAEGGFHVLNTLITAVELMAGTKYLFPDEKFGNGISSTTTASDSTFFKIGGVRFKKSADPSWTYARWTDSVNPTVGGTSYKSNWSSMFNFEYPKEQCMESQMAVSMAVELGIAPTVSESDRHDFYFYGDKYYYMTVDGMDAPRDGALNARLYKPIAWSYDDDNDGSVSVEGILRFSIFSGMMLCGDVYGYCGGGAELVATVNVIDGGSWGNPVGFYLQPDQTKWKRISDAHALPGATFGFEDSYINVIKEDGKAVTTRDGWRKNRTPFAPFATEGSTRDKGDCLFINDANWYNYNRDETKGYRTRLALRFGYHAIASFCAPRSLICNNNASYALRNFAGRAQTLVRIAQ